MKNNFVAVHVRNLSLEEVYALCRSTIDLSEPVAAELGSIGNAALTQLAESASQLGMALNKSQRSALTPEAQAAEQARDTDILEIFRINKTYLKSNNKERRLAASELQLFLSPYRNVSRLPVDVESGVIFKMLKRYHASPELQAAAVIVGIDGTFADLEKHNNEFNDLFNSRTKEKAARPASATSFKTKTIAAYSQYSAVIEQALQFAPSDALQALFNQLNELRKTYRSLESKGAKKEKK